ncbi:MAG: DNA polymerase III subunit beta [Candidatus Magasanikbacteria bacterium]|nr:DNA polymerase III subunit beta [Candidatus Magasanikbacteria bacterium]
MKFTCTRENLLSVLHQVSGIANKHTNLPILNNVLIQVGGSKVELVSTNLEIAIKTNLRAKIENEGSFTVPAKTLTDFINLLPEEQIHISLEENELIVKCGSSKTKIKGVEADDYPVIPEIEEKNGYVLSAEGFKDSLAKVVVAVAKNEIRQELSGVYFGFFNPSFKGLTLAGTDSYRLAEKKIEISQGDESFECIVPSKSVQELVRLIGTLKGEQAENNVRLWVSENQISVRFANFEMSSRLVGGKYPDYTQIIPKEFKTGATVSNGSLVKKIKAASLFTTLGVNAVNFKIGDGEMTVSSTSTQTGEHSSSLDAKVVGDGNEILLNHRYVLDGLQQISGSEVILNINTSDTPCLLKPKNDNSYIYIVMPIRQ